MKEFSKDLLKRTLTSTVAIALVCFFLFFAYAPFFPLVLFLVIGALGFAATYELIMLCEKKAHLSKKILLIFCPIVILTFHMAGLLLFDGTLWFAFLALFIFILLVFLVHFRDVAHAIVDISVNLFSIIYISIPLGMLIYILYAFKESYTIDGRMWVLIILVLTKASDIFAYLVGKVIGKNPLAKSISPNKTVEGSLAGLFAAALLAMAIQYYFPAFSFSYTSAAIFGLIVGGISQIGDLCESLLKRDAKVKDSNNLPGLGGVLDALDSLLFTVPVFYLYLI